MRALLVFVVVAIAAGGSYALARWSEGADAPQVRRGEPLRRAGSADLLIAGSGSNVAITRSLVRDLPSSQVFNSIGSGGGVRALLDEVIDVAMISRPLKDREADQGLVAVPYARTLLVWAVDEEATVRETTLDELAGLYADGGAWSDGSRAVPLLREIGDSGIAVVRRTAPHVADAHDDSVRTRRFDVLLTDRAMRRALKDVEDAFGLTDLGQLGSSRALIVDGLEPTLENIDRYPFIRTLSLVFREPISDKGRRLLEHIRSEGARERLREHGYEPLLGVSSDPP